MREEGLALGTQIHLLKCIRHFYRCYYFYSLSPLLPQSHRNKHNWTSELLCCRFHEDFRHSWQLKVHQVLEVPLCEREKKEPLRVYANVLLLHDQCAHGDSGGVSRLLHLSDHACVDGGGRLPQGLLCYLLLIGWYVIMLSWLRKKLQLFLLLRCYSWFELVHPLDVPLSCSIDDELLHQRNDGDGDARSSLWQKFLHQCYSSLRCYCVKASECQPDC